MPVFFGCTSYRWVVGVIRRTNSKPNWTTCAAYWPTRLLLRTSSGLLTTSPKWVVAVVLVFCVSLFAILHCSSVTLLVPYTRSCHISIDEHILSQHAICLAPCFANCASAYCFLGS